MMLHTRARCGRRNRNMSLKCGIVGLAQRRQVDAVQRADQGGHRRRELSVLHDRAERRHRRGARPAPRGARRDREAAEGDPGDRGVRRHRRARRRRVEGRGPRQPVPRQHPRDRRDRARRALLRGRQRRPRRRQGRSGLATSRRSTPSSRSPTSQPSRSSSRTLRARSRARRRQGSAAAGRGCSRTCEPALERGAGRRARVDLYAEETALLQPLFLLTMKPTMYVANVAEHGFEDNPLLDARARPTRAKEGAPVVADLRGDRSRDRRPRRRGQADVPRRHGHDRAGPRPRDPRRLRAARPADLLHRRAEGSARVDHPQAARRRRRPPA